jgi:hypothetical protein
MERAAQSRVYNATSNRRCQCVDLLINTDRTSAAALFARTSAPRYVTAYYADLILPSDLISTFLYNSQVPKTVKVGKKGLDVAG